MSASTPRDLDPNRSGDWDDARLAAAFAARSAATPSTPVDIWAEVLARANPARNTRPRWPSLAAALATVAIVLLLGAWTVQLRPGPSDQNGAASASPNPLPTQPVGTALPAVPVAPISVGDALAIRDAGSAMEILVEGFLSPMPPVPCPFEPNAGNPTRLVCPETFQWFMERPQSLSQNGADGFDIRPPSGAATQLSFALVESPPAPWAADKAADVPVVLLGHFHDRRARLCLGRPACEQTFIVDRVVSVAGSEQPVVTWRKVADTARDLESDVDDLVGVAAPTAAVVSRQLVSVAQAIELEPVLANDYLVPHVDQSKLAWLVTTVDRIDGQPFSRTFMLLDGSNWFAEITGVGARPYERRAPEPGKSVIPFGPTAEPDAFASAPDSVLGMPVRGVGEVNRERDNTGGFGSGEYAIRGWYIAPRPGFVCDPVVATIHAPAPPCDDARHWLLSDPQVYGIDVGQLRNDPDPQPSTLNPLLPVDVPFDVAASWRGEVPAPQPVIVLGHFNDRRVSTFHGNAYFVIDALAWNRTSKPIDRVIRMTDATTEDPAAVTARVAAVSPGAALATWLTAVAPADFAVIEANAAAQEAAELTADRPVWILRQLVLENDEQGPRYAVLSAFTADRGSRIWLTPRSNADVALATSIDLRDLDSNTTILRVFDEEQSVAGVRRATGLGPLSWQLVPGTNPFVDIARGSSSNEVVLRWRGDACQKTWDLRISTAPDGVGLHFGVPAQCVGTQVIRRVVIVFDHPVDIDTFNSGFCCG